MSGYISYSMLNIYIKSKNGNYNYVYKVIKLNWNESENAKQFVFGTITKLTCLRTKDEARLVQQSKVRVRVWTLGIHQRRGLVDINLMV